MSVAKDLSARVAKSALTAFVFLAVGLSHTPARAQSDQGWRQYFDPGTGLSFAFPAHVFSLRSASRQRGGVMYSTPDGRARILAFGYANRDGASPATVLRRMADFRSARFTYVRTTPRFFVASGTRKGKIFYRRCNFVSSGRVSCFHVEYPQSEKRQWDHVVTRISHSLRTASR